LGNFLLAVNFIIEKNEGTESPTLPRKLILPREGQNAYGINWGSAKSWSKVVAKRTGIRTRAFTVSRGEIGILRETALVWGDGKRNRT